MAPSTRFRTALITGGTRGLGRELVRLLDASGARTWTVARRRRGIEALERELPGVNVFQGDLAAPGTAARIGRRLAKDGVTLDLLIHNAGLLGPRVPLAEWSRKDFAAVVAVNLLAPFDLTRRLLPRFHSGARIVFITSGVTAAVRREWGAYQVSKVAVENLAATFALEFGTAGPQVMIFDPGAMQTEMRREAYPDEDTNVPTPPEQVAEELLRLAGRDDWQSGSRLSMPPGR